MIERWNEYAEGLAQRLRAWNAGLCDNMVKIEAVTPAHAPGPPDPTPNDLEQHAAPTCVGLASTNSSALAAVDADTTCCLHVYPLQAPLTRTPEQVPLEGHLYGPVRPPQCPLERHRTQDAESGLRIFPSFFWCSQRDVCQWQSLA
jgi:hypothetical protein